MTSARWILSITTALMSLAAAPAPADACSCGPRRSPCQAAWSATDVFGGNVVAVTTPNVRREHRPVLGTRLVRVRTTDTFRGTATGEVEVWTGQGGGDCGFDFTPGKAYLIYAHRDPAGRLSTSICSRTALVAHARQDLAHLRGPGRSTPTGGRIIGRAVLQEMRPDGSSARGSPFAGARVTLESGGRVYEAVTGNNGAFEVHVPVAAYTVHVTVPEGRYAVISGKSAGLDSRDCGSVDILVRWDGRVAGRAVTANREPVPHIRVFGVALDPGGSPTANARIQVHDAGALTRLVGPAVVTGPDGRFALTLVAGRQYRLTAEGFEGGRPVSRAEGPTFEARTDLTDMSLTLHSIR